MAHVWHLCQDGARNPWRTSGSRCQKPHLAPVPRAAGPQPLNEQLAAVMSRKRVSQRELAKRLAAIDHTKPESKRRWLGKLLKGEVANPDRETVRELEQALALSTGYFKTAVPAGPLTRQDRLAALEAEVVRLREEHDSFVKGALARLAALEAAPGRARQRSDQRSKGGRAQ